LFAALIAACWLGGQIHASFAQTRSPVSAREVAKLSPRKERGPTKDSELAENRYTAGLVAGPPHSTDFAVAQDIATTLASGQETGPHGEMALRVLPMLENGGTRNILDTLTLAGADMAIAPVVLVDRLRDAKTFGDIRDELVYIVPLFVEEFHLLARPEIESVADLAGKTVSLGEDGSPSAVLGREILNDMGATKVSEVNLPLDAALDGMRKGDISAMLLVSGKPVDALRYHAQGDGIHFLRIPYSPALQRDYVPATLRHEDYPDIIEAGESVDTIATRSALFAYNWPSHSERYGLMELFVQTLFSRFPEFLGDTHHPKWREVNLAAELPGWQRFRPAERWLRRQPGAEADLRNAFGRFLQEKSVGNMKNRDELFQQFMRWRQRKQGR
jgi:TRAP-type uncharacterized transport system substrate-binding protein